MRRILKICLGAAFCVFAGLPSYCWGLELLVPDRAWQGDVFLGQIRPPASVFVDGTAVPVSVDGYFIIGISRERKNDLVVLGTDGAGKVSARVLIMKYSWAVQRIDGLADEYVEPPLKAMRQIKRDNRRVQNYRTGKSHPEPLFLKDGFAVPVTGPVTSIFGSQRILNGRARSPHRGIDFAAPEGTPVVSPADGIVTFAKTGMYLMGNVLMVDHGLGVRSFFIHLNGILAREGALVKKGEKIALVGKTGRATGPHLHWGVSVGATLVDPARLLNRSLVRK